MLYRVCQSYHALPSAGGVLDQSVEFLKMHSILSAGGYFDDNERPSVDSSSSIPMVTL